MHRRLLAALAVLLVAGCAPAFRDRRTPSGEFCSDMPVVPAGQEPDREYHRLQPITSDPKARTEAERLESLRKAACSVGGDAVIEAVNEEVRADNGIYALVSSGTAVVWSRRAGTELKPLTFHPKVPPPPTVEPAPPPPPTAEPTAEPSASASASAPPSKAGKPPAPGKSGQPAAKPAPSGKKLTKETKE